VRLEFLLEAKLAAQLLDGMFRTLSIVNHKGYQDEMPGR